MHDNEPLSHEFYRPKRDISRAGDPSAAYTVVRGLTSKFFSPFFFVLYINFKLSDDFFKKKIKISRPNGENWSLENFEIFSAKAN
jgi:hypothetical protein